MPTYAPIGKASFSSATYNYYGLLSDGDDVVSRPGTIASGTGVVTRGTIVNCDPATGAITIPATVATCNGILADDTDATSATVPANVYLTGKFKADALTWPGALSHALVTDQLRDYGIYIESVVFTDGSISKSVPKAEEEAAAKKIIEQNKAAKEKAAKEAEAKAKGEKEEEPQSTDAPWDHLTSDQKEKEPELAQASVWINEPNPGSGEKASKPAESPAHRGEQHSPKR